MNCQIAMLPLGTMWHLYSAKGTNTMSSPFQYWSVLDQLSFSFALVSCKLTTNLRALSDLLWDKATNSLICNTPKKATKAATWKVKPYALEQNVIISLYPAVTAFLWDLRKHIEMYNDYDLWGSSLQWPHMEVVLFDFASKSSAFS